MKKESGATYISSAFLLVFFLMLFIFLLSNTIATQSGTSGAAALTIWTNGTQSGENLTFGNPQKTVSVYNFYFMANLTNSTGSYINSTVGNGNCTIIFNQSGTPSSPIQLTYQNNLWTANNTFNYKGNISFMVTCTSAYGNITNLTDYFYVRNTPPYKANPFISITFSNQEDNFTANNFSQYIVEDDYNDVLTYSILNITSSKHSATSPSYYQSWIWINSSNGLIYMNATNDTEAANYNIAIQVLDNGNSGSGIAGLIETVSVNVQAENDPPYFLNLGGARAINKSGIALILSALDEELDLNYTFNVSFPACTHTALNPPTGADNCTLFNLTYYNATATNITFTPAANQKGEYMINFSVADSRNATYTTILNWTVSWNDAPYFTYTCGNERNATENSQFNCYINASDADELNNITIVANYTWFTFNDTQTNRTIISTGSTGNASAFVNFTPSDMNVGNWSINISVTDTGALNSSTESNFTTFYFFINNTEDPVYLQNIPNLSNAYTSQNYTILVNATDDDILIPDKNVYNETLTFTTNNSHITVSNQLYFSGTNRSQVSLTFNPNDLGTGEHTINVTVRDKGNSSAASDLFTITVVGNTAPQWNSTTATNFTLTEDVPFYLNLSKNVTDSDILTFSRTLLDNEDFDSFSINATTGIINFTPIDNSSTGDVGIHQVRITADDNKTTSSLDITLTINNVNDPISFLQMPATNASYSAAQNYTNITAQEDNYTSIYFLITDDDLYIRQRDFFQEQFMLNLTIQGPNTSLFAFSNPIDQGPTNNRYQWSAIFTPDKSDVGQYNVSINVSDSANHTIVHSFNLTVIETLHNPNITQISNNTALSILNDTFYADFNATDEEDGVDAVGGNLTFVITNLTARGNFLTINSSTGVINFTSNNSLAGIWAFRVTVNDTDNSQATDDFNLTIYDYPQIILPNSTFTFNLKENVSATLNFTANHTVQDDLNFSLYINSIYKNITSGPGNATSFLWNYTANFTEETTCSGAINLTLNVSNSKLSNTTSWQLTINHTDYPTVLLSSIPDQNGASPLTLDLSDYFYDQDVNDYCINSTLQFSYSQIQNSSSGGEISVEVTNKTSPSTTPTAVFSASTDGVANYTFTAYEVNSTNSTVGSTNSNNFSVTLTTSSDSVSTPSSGGGGGGGTRVVSLKIIVPDPVSAKQKDKLIIPIGLQNDGTVDLNGITLSATIAKDGALRSDLIATLDQSFFTSLKKNEKKNLTMVVDIDTESLGLFEITLDAEVNSPKYHDWAKIYIQIEKDKNVLERILFTEDFLIGNPQCAELVDLVNDAKSLYAEGKVTEALDKAESSLEACKRAITQPPKPRLYEALGTNFITYTAIASLLAFAIGFGYYTYQKIKLRRQLRGY